MKKLLLALSLCLSPLPAFANCNGVFNANSFCGTVSGGPPGQLPFSTIPVAPGGATTDVQINLGGALHGDSGFTYAGSGGPVTIDSVITITAPTASTPSISLGSNQGTFETSNGGTQAVWLGNDGSSTHFGAIFGSGGGVYWSSAGIGTEDTGLTRTAAGTVSVGNGAAGDFSGTFNAALYEAGGTAGVTKTCGATIVVKGGIITSC